MTEPRVSVVIIARDVRDELGPCLASIRDHAGVATETIVVDNASTDGTVEWLRREHPEVETIRLDENVWDSARNRGLERARGDYTLFLDSDARLTPGALVMLVDALDRNPEWGLVAPRLVYPDGELQLSCRRFPPGALPFMRRPPLRRFLDDCRPVRRHLMADLDHSTSRRVVYVIGACQLFRTALGRELGGMDVAIGRGGMADVDWCIRVWDSGRSVVYLPQATVVHDYRRASNQRPLSRQALHHLASFVLLQRRYRGRRRELARFADELDGEGSVSHIATQRPIELQAGAA